LLIVRRRRPIGEPALEPGQGAPAFVAGASAHDGPAGAGRIVHALTELGLAQPPYRQLVVDPDAPIEALDAVDLGSRSDIVVLGSHLVNLPSSDVRAALLALARRHLAAGGTLLVEHHPLDWAESAADVRPTPGSASPGMIDVRRDPPFVAAVSVYDVGGRVVRQPFTARVLSDADLDAALEAAGLARVRRLSPTWLRCALRPDGHPQREDDEPAST
jgi:hypothetical protein